MVYPKPYAFREALKASGKTQGALCRAAGIHPTVLSDWLHGRRELRRDVIVVLAHHIGVPAAEIAEDSPRCPRCGIEVAA